MTSDSKEKEPYKTILHTAREAKPETVQQLAKLVKEKLPNSEKEIINAILKLQSQEKLKLTLQPEPIPQGLAAFLKTGRASWFWATMALSISTALVVFTVPEDLYPWVYIRYVLGTIFVLWLPGYTFMRALFPAQLPFKTLDKNLETIERVALSIGMSLALVPIVGLLLNYTPWGIRLAPITISLLALSITFATAAILREHQAGTKQDTKN